MSYIPTYKQATDMLQIIEKPHSVLTGAVRSGKTVAMLFSLPILIKKHIENTCVICSKTLATTERNLLRLLRQMFGEKHIGTIRDKNRVILFGKIFDIIPFTDESSYQKLQGMSIGLAICDETVLMPESFFLMLQTRLDKSDSQDIHTCNPGSPNHFLKKWMDDKEIEKYVSHYTIYDNPHLSKEVVHRLETSFNKNETFKKRYIDGLWVNTDGLACYAFNENIHLINRSEYNINSRLADALLIGVDGANINDKTCLSPMLTDYNGNAVVFQRFEHDPTISGQLTNVAQVQLIKQYLKDLDSDIKYEQIGVDKILVVDCAAADLILQLRNELPNWLIVEFTKKDIKRTLEVMNNVFNSNKIRIIKSTDYDYNLGKTYNRDALVEELQSVKVKDKKDKAGVQLVDSDANDAFDSLRYVISYRYRRDYFKDEETGENE